MAATEVHRVALQKADLGAGEDHGVALGVLLKAHQALVAGLDPMAQPHAPDATGADFGAGQTQLVGDALSTMGGEAQGVVQDLLFDL